MSKPRNFEHVWSRIDAYRRANPAPVDALGCDRLAQGATPQEFRFQVLLSLLLSSQTRDQVTAAAVGRLRAHHNGSITIDGVLQTGLQTIEALIRPVSFYKRKAVFVKAVAEALKARQDIPDSAEALMALPGVGPKMAYLVMAVAWNRVEGIGVDVHVARISKRLGWAGGADPEAVRRELQGFLERERWLRINTLLVGFGQTLCTAQRPKCAQCPVKEYCNYYRLNW